MNVQRQGRAESPARSLSIRAVTILAAKPGPIPEINCKRASGSVLKSTVTHDWSRGLSCNSFRSGSPSDQRGPITSPCKPRRIIQKRIEAFCHWRISAGLRFNSSPFVVESPISAEPDFPARDNPGPLPRLQYRVWQTSPDWFRERNEPADWSDIAETERLRVWELSW